MQLRYRLMLTLLAARLTMPRGSPELSSPDIGRPGATDCPPGSVAVSDVKTCMEYAARYSRARSGPGQSCSKITGYSAACEGPDSPAWCKMRPVGCWADVASSSGCYFFNNATINGPGAGNPLSAPVCAKQTSTRSRLGNYGFLSYFGVTPEEIVQQVDDMFDAAGVRDVQFYDWFANYAGRYQNYSLVDKARGKASAADWWKSASWTDPWDSHMLVRRDTLLAAVRHVQMRGGRAWAYLQVVGSEQWDLAGASDSPCGSKLPPGVADQHPYNVELEGQICKLTNATGDWVMQESPQRIFPTYMANGALAVHQVDAWVGILEEFGFDGVHWDTLGAKAADYDVESRKMSEFVTVAGRLLKQHGLLQTLNQVDTHWWNPSLFSDGILEFPYSEIWWPIWHEKFRERVAGIEGAVIAAYPGTDMNGCPCIDETDCHLSPRGAYGNCPGNMTQEALLEARWKDACDHGHRYVIVGNGLRRLVTEFFPWTVPLAARNLAFIQNYTCSASTRVRVNDGGIDSGFLLTMSMVLLIVCACGLCLSFATMLTRFAYQRIYMARRAKLVDAANGETSAAHSV